MHDIYNNLNDFLNYKNLIGSEIVCFSVIVCAVCTFLLYLKYNSIDLLLHHHVSRNGLACNYIGSTR